MPYLGIGTGASGMLGAPDYELLRTAAPRLPKAPADAWRVRLTVTSGRRAFAEAAGMGELSYDLEFLTEPQAAAEDLMLGMRLSKGVGEDLLAHARDVLGAQAVGAAVAEARREGLAEARADGGLAPTRRGWLLGNELYGIMWGLAPGTVREVGISCATAPHE